MYKQIMAPTFELTSYQFNDISFIRKKHYYKQFKLYAFSWPENNSSYRDTPYSRAMCILLRKFSFNLILVQ